MMRIFGDIVASTCAALPFLFHNVLDTPCQGAAFLGAAHNPFWIEGDAGNSTYRADMLTLPDELTPGRLQHRRSLLEEIGRVQNTSHPAGQQFRRFADRADQLLESQAIRRALDLSQESERTREHYGYYTTARAYEGADNGLGNGRQIRGQNLLLARRLVEAGVPFVSPRGSPILRPSSIHKYRGRIDEQGARDQRGTEGRGTSGLARTDKVGGAAVVAGAAVPGIGL